MTSLRSCLTVVLLCTFLSIAAAYYTRSAYRRGGMFGTSAFSHNAGYNSPSYQYGWPSFSSWGRGGHMWGQSREDYYDDLYDRRGYDSPW